MASDFLWVQKFRFGQKPKNFCNSFIKHKFFIFSSRVNKIKKKSGFLTKAKIDQKIAKIVENSPKYRKTCHFSAILKHFEQKLSNFCGYKKYNFWSFFHFFIFCGYKKSSPFLPVFGHF